MLSGDNSILSKAGEARDITGEKQIEEKVYIAVNGAISNGLGTLSYDNLNSELAKQFKTYEIDPKADAESWTVTVTENGITKTYTIYASGQIEVADNSGVEISLVMTHLDSVPTAGGNVASVNSENIPIPTGFYAVAGTSKDTGFVISSVANDDLDNTKGGDQFVWVPVEQNQKLKLEVDSEEDITGIKLIDPFGEEINLGTVSGKTYNNTNITPTCNGLYKVEVTTAGGTVDKTLVVRSLYAKDRFNDYMYSDECTRLRGYDSAIAMAQGSGYDSVDALIADDNEYYGRYADPVNNYASSVNTYGGFYIGRFEAGIATKITSGNSSGTVSYIETAIEKPLSQKNNSNTYVTKFEAGLTIKRITAVDIIAENGNPLSQKNKDLYTNVNKSQASELADNMYLGISHLLIGAAWDRTLGWIIDKNNKTLAQVVGDSKDWGNYDNDTFSNTTEIAKTGQFSQTKALNIYDLAGNASEWTSEISPYFGEPCVCRGGYFNDEGSYTSNHREYYNEIIHSYSSGFRVALFL